MKSKSKKIIIALIVLVVTVFLGSQAYALFFNKYTTCQVVDYTTVQYVKANAYFIRNEQTVKSKENGYKVYSVANGMRVSKGSKLVAYYSDENAATVEKRTNELQNRIDVLKKLNEQNDYYVADLNVVSGKIESNLNSIINGVNSRDFSELSSEKTQLLLNLAQIQLIAGREKNYDSALEKLNAEIAALKSSYASEKTVAAPAAGYFVNRVDGYENVFDYENIESFTADDFDNIKPEKVDNNSIGKIITVHEWFIAAEVDINDIGAGSGVYEGKDVKLEIDNVQNTVAARIIKINGADKKSGKAVIIMSCKEMNDKLIAMRSCDIRIRTGSFEGLRVSSAALRMKDENIGVYVLINGKPVFRKFRLLYSNKEYAIVTDKDDEGYAISDAIRIYDDAIIGGRDLDG